MKSRFCAVIRAYCREQPIPCGFAGLVMLLWGCTPFLLFINSSSPVEYLPGLEVSPYYAKEGGEVWVTRHFHIHRLESIKIVRRMERGDCNVSCERLDDLASTVIVNKVGLHQTSKRPIQLPRRATAGVWTIRSSIHWDNFIGRKMTMEAPPFNIEIIP